MHLYDVNDLEIASKKRGDIIGWLPDVRGERGKINPHLTRFVTKDGGAVDVFHVKPVYYETIHGAWRPLSEVTHYHGNHEIVFNESWWNVHPRYMSWLQKRAALINGKVIIPTSIPSPFVESLQYARAGHVGLTTLTAYPDPHPESTTVDGWAWNDGMPAVWSTVHDASTATGTNDNATILAPLVQTSTGSNTKGILRPFILWDTSAISTDTVDSATIDLWMNTANRLDNITTGSSSWNIGKCTGLASNTAVASGDFDAIDNYTGVSDDCSTAKSYATIGAALDQYQTYTLNATGIAHINKSGVSSFAWREHTYDMLDVDPADGGSNTNRQDCASADYSGTGRDPKLVVEHSAGGGASRRIFNIS